MLKTSGNTTNLHSNFKTHDKSMYQMDRTKCLNSNVSHNNTEHQPIHIDYYLYIIVLIKSL